jgi:D-sedoheptulose 7-phosphate isomerase
MSFAAEYVAETRAILERLDLDRVEALARLVADTRDRGGRVFVLGVGGSAANASHAVNDLRKLARVEAYAPTDNAAELTARTNDEGWPSVFEGWLDVSRLSADDAILVLSVGGGDLERDVSPNLVRALDLARARGARIGGVVGRDGGYTARVADACVIIPTAAAERVTPHTEGLQSVVLHLVVSHPAVQVAPTKWESVAAR